jgi:hypothetical protein
LASPRPGPDRRATAQAIKGQSGADNENQSHYDRNLLILKLRQIMQTLQDHSAEEIQPKRSRLWVEPAHVTSCISQIRSRARMERDPPDGAGPVHVPFGHVVASEKWRGSLVAQGMQGR